MKVLKRTEVVNDSHTHVQISTIQLQRHHQKNCKKGQCDRLAALVSCNSITKRSIDSNLNKNTFECEARNKADARKYHMEDTRNKLRC